MYTIGKIDFGVKKKRVFFVMAVLYKLTKNDKILQNAISIKKI